MKEIKFNGISNDIKDSSNKIIIIKNAPVGTKIKLNGHPNSFERRIYIGAKYHVSNYNSVQFISTSDVKECVVSYQLL
jgi:hypothetical protein